MKHFVSQSARVLAITAVVAFANVTSVQAQPEAVPGSPAGQLTPQQQALLEDFQQKRAELLQLGRQLNEIRQATMTKHPELKEREKAFGDRVAAQMKSDGATPAEDLAELRALQSKLRDETTPEADRQALLMRLQRKAQEFDQARRQALQNPELQQEQEQLLKDIVAAMKAENKQTEQIMQQMHQKQQEMTEIRKAAQAAGQ